MSVEFAEERENARRAAGLARTVRAGLAHHQAGRLDRAEALYRKALVKDPGCPDALHLLGVVAYQSGKIRPALQLIGRALPALAELPDAHLNYGNALQGAGRWAEAAESYRRAIALDPDYGMAHSNLARALLELRQFDAALESARRAIELLPDFAGAHVNYADALVGLERYAEAEAPLRRALELMPDEAEVFRSLGGVCVHLERLDEAITHLERAVALAPNNPVAHRWLGLARYKAEDLVGSEASFRRTLALVPNSARTWHDLGDVVRLAGRFEEALTYFRRALEIDPDLAEAHRSLAVTGQQASDEEQLARLRALASDPERPVSGRISAGFALGALLDNADRCDEAFPYFAEANALHRQELAEAGERFDLAALRDEVDRLIRNGTPALFSAIKSWGNPSELPVFIVGMPRSGTSLVEQILASHSRVFGAGERLEINRIWDTLSAHNRGKPIPQWDAAFARQLADQHVAYLQTLGGEAVRVTDKLPDNVFYLWLIAALFPSARVILNQRDPRDICLSCYFHRFTEGNLFSYDLADCGHRALEVERLATHWLRVLPVEMLAIDYEELVNDLEGESRRLIEFLGLDWEPACLDFYRTDRPVFTASSWQVRQPLYTRSVGRWRCYEKHLGPLFEVLAEANPL